MSRGPWSWLVPILLVLLITPFFPTLDLYFSGLAFDPELGKFPRTALQLGIYRYFPWVGNTLATAAFGVVLLSYRITDWKPYRGCCWVVILTLLLGSGWLVNEVLKEYWGRPRPVQIVNFGGIQEYRAWYYPHFFNPITSRSFPSGHASAGWFYLCLIPVGWRLKSPTVVKIGATLAVIMGGALSYCRIAMGGHFFSDCVFAALVMWLTALALDRFFCGGVKEEPCSD